MTALTSIAAFLVAIAILVTVHEYGHYLAARSMGVKVLRFSIGFGRPLYQRRFGRDRTEFVVAAIPLGGYVRMLDEREAPVATTEHGRAFNRQSLAARNFVIVAGPLANFLFACVAYALMFMVGVPGMKPMVGAVEEGSLAERGGLRMGDEILRIDGRRIQDWEQANLRLLDLAVRATEIPLVVRDATGQERELRLPIEDRRDLLGEGVFLLHLGVQPLRPPLLPWIGQIERGSPAEHAGLRPGDRILQVEGQAVASWAQWVEWVQSSPGQPLRLLIERNGSLLEPIVTPAAVPGEAGVLRGRIGAGVDQEQPHWRELATVTRLGPLEGLWEGTLRTWEVSILTLRVLGRMLVGEASIKNIAGPVTIAEFAGTTALLGLSTFLGFLALVSVSLGIINLLPIPVLDGGHLLFNFIEWVKGSALSERALLFGQQVGLILIAALMLLAFYNDFSRWFG